MSELKWQNLALSAGRGGLCTEETTEFLLELAKEINIPKWNLLDKKALGCCASA